MSKMSQYEIVIALHKGYHRLDGIYREKLIELEALNEKMKGIKETLDLRYQDLKMEFKKLTDEEIVQFAQDQGYW